MAKKSTKQMTKSKAKRPAKHYPCVRTIRLTDLSSVLTTNRIIEADRVLSEANRRMYRQSYVYSMKVDLDITSSLASSGVGVYVLNDTWDLHQAYSFAMKNFYNAMKEELAASPNQAGRWMDFKIQSAVAADVMYPVVLNNGLTETRLDTGEHQYSQVVDDGGLSRTFGLHEISSGTSWSILGEWATVDRTDADPSNPTVQPPYQGLTDEIDGGNLTLLNTQYESPPYSVTTNTQAFRKVGDLRALASGAQKLSTGYFDAPLGIVILTGVVGDAGTKGIQVSFQAGDYKGVKASRYATPVLTEAKEYEVV